MATISIIIPVYNVESYIVKCLDSCLNQTFNDVEIIAVNDGSSDASGTVLDNYALKEPRLKVFHQNNSGVVVARNVGILNATGEWYAFVDSDDFLEFDAFDLLYNAVIEHNAEISVGKFRNASEKGEFGRENTLTSLVNATQKECAEWLLTEKLSFSLCGKLFKASLFKNIEADATLKLGEDAYITLQLFANAAKYVSVDKVVYNYLQRASSVTHNPSLAAINSIQQFIRKTVCFYQRQPYFTDSDFTTAVNYFIIKEYFTYLRMGGEYISNDVKDLVNAALKDRCSCDMTPRWRLMMLKFFKMNKQLGKVYRFLFVNLRVIVQKIHS